MIALLAAALLATAALVHLDKPEPKKEVMVIRMHYHEDNLFPYVVSDTSFVRGDSLGFDR